MHESPKKYSTRVRTGSMYHYPAVYKSHLYCFSVNACMLNQILNGVPVFQIICGALFEVAAIGVYHSRKTFQSNFHG